MPRTLRRAQRRGLSLIKKKKAGKKSSHKNSKAYKAAKKAGKALKKSKYVDQFILSSDSKKIKKLLLLIHQDMLLSQI